MKEYTCYDSIPFQFDPTVSKSDEIALVAWNPNNYDKFAKYNVSIIINNDPQNKIFQVLKLDDIEINSVFSHWLIIEKVKWIDVTDYAPFSNAWVTLESFTKSAEPIQSEDDKIENNLSRKKREINNSDAVAFKIVVKSKLESASNKVVEVVEPDEKNCLNSVSTVGDNVPYGVQCPTDPDTGQMMERCLNWRRLDEFGYKCRQKINDIDINYSIDDFCKKYPTAQDCKCKNRKNLDKNYNVLQNGHLDHAVCWYKPCADGNYLVKTDEKNAICADQTICQVNYQYENRDGTINSRGNVNQNCSSRPGIVDPKTAQINIGGNDSKPNIPYPEIPTQPPNVAPPPYEEPKKDEFDIKTITILIGLGVFLLIMFSRT